MTFFYHYFNVYLSKFSLIPILNYWLELLLFINLISATSTLEFLLSNCTFYSLYVVVQSIWSRFRFLETLSTANRSKSRIVIIHWRFKIKHFSWNVTHCLFNVSIGMLKIIRIHFVFCAAGNFKVGFLILE